MNINISNPTKNILRLFRIFFVLPFLLLPQIVNADTDEDVISQWDKVYRSEELLDFLKEFSLELEVPESNSDIPESDIPESWGELTEELMDDGLNQAWIEDVFVRLGSSYTTAPMKTKLTELYRIDFGKKKKAKDEVKEKESISKKRHYKKVLTKYNANRAMLFLEEHDTFFSKSEESYGVSKEIAVSLLLVETDLGSYMGRQKALGNLASMAASRTPDEFYSYLPSVKGDEKKEEWIQSVLDKRSAWAYQELKALLEYTYANQIDPLELSGSIYGAIGYCQFMPSNILRFGVDGNNDGKIDLFDTADAIPSLSNYLKEHGWKDGLPENEQRKVLLTYNRSIPYANTIMMMAEALEERAELANEEEEIDTVDSTNSTDQASTLDLSTEKDILTSNNTTEINTSGVF